MQCTLYGLDQFDGHSIGQETHTGHGNDVLRLKTFGRDSLFSFYAVEKNRRFFDRRSVGIKHKNISPVRFRGRQDGLEGTV